jgi:hypothetical protein
MKGHPGRCGMKMFVPHTLSFPDTPLFPVQTREELLVDLMANRIVSTCAKVALLNLDPLGDLPFPARKEAVDFLEFLDINCDKQIQTLVRNLK